MILERIFFYTKITILIFIISLSQSSCTTSKEKDITRVLQTPSTVTLEKDQLITIRTNDGYLLYKNTRYIPGPIIIEETRICGGFQAGGVEQAGTPFPAEWMEIDEEKSNDIRTIIQCIPKERIKSISDRDKTVRASDIEVVAGTVVGCALALPICIIAAGMSQP